MLTSRLILIIQFDHQLGRDPPLVWKIKKIIISHLCNQQSRAYVIAEDSINGKQDDSRHMFWIFARIFVPLSLLARQLNARSIIEA